MLSALYSDYIDLLKGNKELAFIVRRFSEYNSYDDHSHHRKMGLMRYFTQLWGYIFEAAKVEPNQLRLLLNIVVKNEKYIDRASLYLKILECRREHFPEIINQANLDVIEERLSDKSQDYFKYISHCFILSKLFSILDANKAIHYFREGISNGILRHGYHKDIIISFKLIESIEAVWEKSIKVSERHKVFNRQCV